MLRVFSLLIAITVLCACASRPVYRQAENGGFGYQESKLSDTQYRVHFKAFGTDKMKAMDYVMLRAAEVTLENGYSWFKVTNRQTTIDKENVGWEPNVGFRQRYTRVTECSGNRCRKVLYPMTGFDTGIFIGGTDRKEIESIISIVLGKGEASDDPDIFDANQVRTNLLPKTDSTATE